MSRADTNRRAAGARARLAAATALAGLLVLAGCGGDDDSSDSDSATTTSAATATSADAATSTTEAQADPTDSTDAPATTAPDAEAIAFGEPAADGSVPVTLDPGAWSGLYSGFSENAGDPFHQIHSEGEGSLYFNVELYTVYGSGWTGETGTFATDCEANGICVYLDVDGTGPAAAVLADASGEIEIRQIEGGYDMTLTGLTFAGSPTHTIASVDLTA
ncbi:MAG: hypothetical protein M5U31_15710 [Acidimicrobiia bacterium]|nr:hypothetical protein [Acidimicrobiia bacterium]